ncbi:phage protease [Epibacterium ulvae]|uniref:phage protease n=1 Tax=Epibacterium ulvae TaxID=1156985 RepID=UPI002491A739|nr:phage protease [Epibacterium ulvae]
MTKQLHPTQTVALALNTSEAGAPDWVQLTPAGPRIQGRDGRSWTLSDPFSVVAAFADYAADLPVDFEHATQVKGEAGEPALAVGWIKELDVRGGAIWGAVEWTDQGREAVATKGYRYVSPVFTSSKQTGEIRQLLSAGLTNQPNLKMAALNSQDRTEDTNTMDKAILEALGLTEGASSTDVLTAINTLKRDEETARNRAETPDLGKFVPRADYDAAMNSIAGYKAQETERQKQVIKDVVDGGVAAGKITPASREFYENACRAEGGLEKFEAFLETAPELAAPVDQGGLKTNKNKHQLTSEELSMCRQLDMTPEEYLAELEKEA